MPGVVQTDAMQAGGVGDAEERPVDVLRLDRAAGAGGEDVRGRGQLDPARPLMVVSS
ncbi:hypothetical protein AB0L67_03075 [Streptomyces flaveolus]